MRYLIPAILSVGLIGGPAMAETQICTTIIEHHADDQDNPWQTVNDGVMGGLSSGGSALQDDGLVFSGITNTNGGGFSSVRVALPAGLMDGADHLKVHMKRDARTYSLTLRTNVTSFGRRVAFRAPIENAPQGAWGDGILSFENLRASIWGRTVRNAKFDPSDVVELGLIIYDGADGPFEMKLKRIEACRSTVST
ncbi:MAG: CIA30 family protein [Pseudomonadota bacterium]